MLLVGFFDTRSIAAVHHKDQGIGALIIVLPDLADLVLATYIPHSEDDVLVLYLLNVEAYCRVGSHDLTKLQLVEDCGFARSIKTKHKDSHLLFAEQSCPDVCKGQANAARLYTAEKG